MKSPLLVATPLSVSTVILPELKYLGTVIPSDVPEAAVTGAMMSLMATRFAVGVVAKCR